MEHLLRILMIEDSEDDAALIARELKRGGLPSEIHRAETREELVEALGRDHWDAVISDFNLPQFNAHEALKLVRASGQDLPILIVSGAIGEELAADLMRSGAHDVVLKGRLYRLVPAIERELREARERKRRRNAESDRTQALADLRKAVQTRDEFLAIASHELKTPLTPIVMQLQILEREAVQAQPSSSLAQSVLSRLEVVNRQIKRLTALMDNLLDVSRIAHHRLTLDPQPTNLSQTLGEVVAHFADPARDLGYELEVEIEPAVIGDWDPVRMQQIATNLLSNALKYGEKRNPIRIGLKSDGELAVLTVSDQGIGISEADQARIFERFERAVPAGAFAGIGVGLYITKLLVEAHDGRIAVKSKPGQGAKFTVTLPKRRAGSGETEAQLRRA